MRNRVVVALFVIALVLGSALRARDLLMPYENGHRGATAAFFALMAKNHLRYGFQTTGGVGVLNPVKVGPEYFHYYLHHPPGTIWIATIGAALGGTTPYGLRLVFLPFSIGVVILVYRLARSRGRAAAAAAGGIAAMVPIATYYGAFVNFELPTLFFALLALHLYLRFLRRGRRRDRFRCLVATAAAVFCDWIALGLPLALLALAGRRADAATTARAGRRLAAAMLAAGIGVGLLVKAQYLIQVARFGVAPDAGFGYYREATFLAPNFDLERFAESLSGYLTTWYGDLSFGVPASLSASPLGSPLLVLAVLGLLWVLVRAIRGRLDGLDTAALVTLAIGLANLGILANHAAGHDYYLLYLFPAVALLAATTLEAASRLMRLQALLPVALTVLCVHLYLDGERAHDLRTETLLAEAGEKIKANTPQSAVVIMPHYYTLQVQVTADRLVLDAATPEMLTAQLQKAVRYGHVGRPVLFLVDRASADALPHPLVDALQKRAIAPAEPRGPFLAYDLGVLSPTP